MRLKSMLCSVIVVALAGANVPAWAATDPLAPTGRWTASIRGSAATPPMGWNPYNAFSMDISEDKIMGNAQALVDTGLSKLGYVYVNIDDGWWSGRSQTDQQVQVNTRLFPSAAPAGSGPTSFKPFVTRIHQMGLKAGIYSDIGRNTCSQAYNLTTPNLPRGTQAEREVGLYGHVDGDIRTYFKEWGFDYIKIDACGIADYGADRDHVKALGYRPFPPIMFRNQPALSQDGDVRALYAEVGAALAKYKPDNQYVFSICSWGKADVRKWGKDVGNLWRTSDDLYPRWSRMLQSYDSAVTRALYSHPGAWNDPDILYIGAGDFDQNHLLEARSHFSLWTMLDAPLIIGYDLRTADKAMLDIFSNADVIAIDQDRAGNQAVLAYRSGDVDILVKTLSDGRKAVALFNRGLQPFDATLTASQLKFDAAAPVKLTDVWSKESPSPFVGQATFKLAPRETRLFVAQGTRELPGGLYLSEMTGRINVAEDGVTQAEADPQIQRTGWGSTKGDGEWPSYPGWGGAQADASPYSTELSMGPQSFATGIGILSNSRMEVRANGEFRRFLAEVGVDNATRNRMGTVRFFVYGDGRLLAKSDPVSFGQPHVDLSADVTGVTMVELVARADAAASSPIAVDWGRAALLH